MDCILLKAGGGGTGSDELTATAARVLKGYTYVGSDTDDEAGTGTIESKAATTYYAKTSDQTIAAGQYLSGVQTIKAISQSNLSAANIKTGVTITVSNGNGNVWSVAGTFCSDATLDSAAKMLSGVVAYGKNGTKYTGNIGSKAAATYYATTSDQTISAGQYLSGAQTIKKLTQTNLTAANILKGKTITINNGNANVWSVVGTLAVTSAISFSATALSATSIRISWTNPSKGPWEGVFIQMSTSGNPGVSGGTRAYTGKGNSTTAGGSNYADITGLTPGTTYYFTCTSYATGLGNGSSYNVSATTKGKILYWEGSAPYTISNGDTGNMNLYLNSTNIQFTRKYEAGSLSLNIATGNMDLSAYTKFCVSCSITSAIYDKVMFHARYVKTSGTSTLSTVGTVVEGTKSTTLFQTDISSITYTYGKMGIRMYSMDSEGGQSGISGYIYRIWLE